MPSFDFPEIPGLKEPHYDLVGNLCQSTQDVRTIKIIIDGEPVPKGRPRARIVQPKFKPAFISFYQDAATEEYENRVGWHGKAAMKGRGTCMGALRVHVSVFVPIPRSWSGKQHQRAIEGVVLPVSRPDADNYLKCACDALNGICWKDDAQIVDMNVKKRYSEKPRLEIEIFPA